MKSKLFTVFDGTAECSVNPMRYDNKNVAIRSFTMTISDANHPWAQNPGHFTLYEIGEYDDNTMRGEFYDIPRRLVDGMEALEMHKLDVVKLRALQAEIAAIENPPGELEVN